MPASTSSRMQMPREPAPVAFAAERTSIEQPRPIQPMTMEQPELSHLLWNLRWSMLF
ncbi:unnamed protein product [Fusarium graminearum]|uniref:Uncharacterized protein n=1 Tax=Gibberella zeae (strain ATCC MYA-4620 / CBS 123657 / FGSC 9075 / NRRL 31084 / PH-1) TaxID=229533 RepID=I1S7D7_GIBZE|nr:hypothetical protein FGSG_12760 [Fusarium graminearum PH-1]ESU11564.1 hypothetical protein FGSG_12760 [Fusarium graminearum PH-1]CZS84236.1 unnamed protein product [Fusarium graminearum]|eukprot:XP_011324140.1 hypothetical protein FGSG_12760 [Fusarium graminearum PH-1]